MTQLVVKLLGAVDHLGQPKGHIFLTPCPFGVKLGPANHTQSSRHELHGVSFSIYIHICIGCDEISNYFYSLSEMVGFLLEVMKDECF